MTSPIPGSRRSSVLLAFGCGALLLSNCSPADSVLPPSDMGSGGQAGVSSSGGGAGGTSGTSTVDVGGGAGINTDDAAVNRVIDAGRTDAGGGGAGRGAGGSAAGATPARDAGRESSAGAGGAPPPPAVDAGPIGAGKVYGECRFHFGTLDSIARNNPDLIQQIDFFTPGWMGQKDTFDMQSTCTSANPGGTFAKQIPVIVAYVAAFYAKRHDNLKDCNATGTQQSLCQVGAQFIQQNLPNIVATYESYAQGFAGCYGTSRPIIFLMEPDFYQYTNSSQTQPWTAALAGQIMSQFVNAVKSHLPNAVFSLDISPWVGSNGTDNGKAWYSNFDMSLFTFVNTSGGGTDASGTKIRAANNMTWAGVSQVTGKPVMADTGYGVNGRPAGPDAVWDDPTNIDARINDGVVSISQYSPASTWGATVGALHSQVRAPRFCP